MEKQNEQIKYIKSNKNDDNIEITIIHPVISGYSILNIERCQILNIFLHNQHRGLGYGRLLLTETENELKKYGCKEVYLRSLLQAQGFYKRCGYELDTNNVSLSDLLINYKKQL